MALATSLSSSSLFLGTRAPLPRRLAAGVRVGGRPGRRGFTVAMAAGFHALKAKDIDGKEVDFEQRFKGKVVLVTNVASQCGFTNSNYTELVELHKKYADKGLEIVAFPCNQFGGQEPGSGEDIKKFASKYGAQFLLMDKVDVNGPKTSEVYKYLKGACETCSGDVRWNFAAKFIIDKDGNVVERNKDSPKLSESKIAQLLQA
eukprot:jgi/Chlat1/4578/Chrsp290S00321